MEEKKVKKIQKNNNGRSSVLIVDEDASLRVLMRAALEKAGHSVTEATNVEAAVDAFSTKQPDLVLLDIQLDHTHDFPTCRAIRTMPHGIHVPIIMITGIEDINIVEKAYDFGATDFIAKPINWAVLARRIPYIVSITRHLRELEKNQSRLIQMQHLLRVGYWEWNLANDKLTWSKELYEMTGLSKPKSTPNADVQDETYQDIKKVFTRVHPEDRSFVKKTILNAKKNHEPYEIEYRLQPKKNEMLYVHEHVDIIKKDDDACVMFGTVQDITKQKSLENKISYLAYYDHLSKLPNRTFFKRLLDLALEDAKRHGTLLAVLFLDLDNFKHVNDTFGHDVGDLVLQETTKRIRQCIRSNDYISRPGHEEENERNIARLGGDEFTILLKHILSAEDVRRITKRIVHAINKPFHIKNNEVFISVSIGISMYPDDAEDSAALIKRADEGMYFSKNHGKNSYKFYNEDIQLHALRKLNLETQLNEAIKEEKFVLYYQPQFNLKNKNIISVEALIRWPRKIIPWPDPREFIPLIEEVDNFPSIEKWILTSACAQAKKWNDTNANGSDAPILMTINVSPEQLCRTGFLTVVNNVLKKTTLDPIFLAFELSEKAITQPKKELVRVLTKLKDKGIKIVIDNFGTGSLSLQSLSHFPADALKIDTSLIQLIAENDEYKTIVKAIISLAKGLNLQTIAEGVETKEQLKVLRQLGCENVQGFLMQRPVSADEFSKVLNKK